MTFPFRRYTLSIIITANFIVLKFVCRGIKLVKADRILELNSGALQFSMSQLELNFPVDAKKLCSLRLKQTFI